MTKNAGFICRGSVNDRALLKAMAMIAVLAILLSSCTELWGALDNPADPGAESYIGYETVKDPDAIRTLSVTTSYSDSSASLLAAKVAGALNYHFQVDQTGNFTEGFIDFDDDTQPSNLCLDVILPGSVTLYWHVRAKTAAGWGNWSPAAAFTIVPPPLLLTPANASATTTLRPAFTWEAAIGAASYELVLGETEASLDNTDPVRVYSTSWTPANDLALGRWYWRVRWVDGDGTRGEWSITWSVRRTNIDMVSVTGGTFTQGREVTLSDFQIGRYEVTFNQYDAFCTATGRALADDEGWGRGSRPVINVNWEDTVEFCNWLSAKEGLHPAYTSSGDSWTLDRTKDGYRLPTEAEWEYAARGGLDSNGYTYAGSNDINAVAWYNGNAGGRTQPVGGKAPNELGLYDMSGNAWEWNHDWNDSYPTVAETDPVGPSTSSSYSRITRGGSWYNSASYCAVSYRDYTYQENKYDSLGFRVARTQ